MNYNKELKVIKKAAREAGASLAKYFDQKLSIKIKLTNADFVTQADLEANKIITDLINRELPYVLVYSEEKKVVTKDSDYVLIVDPLDGTNNLVLGIPTFSSALTLLYKNQAVANVIYIPMTRQMYWSDGRDSYLGSKKNKTSIVTDLKKSTFAYQQDYLSSVTYKTKFENKFRQAGAIRILNNWSPQFEYGLLASGKIQGVYARNMFCHDYLGGVLLALKAGAKIKYFKKPQNLVEDQVSFIIAANQSILNKMKKILNI